MNESVETKSKLQMQWEDVEEAIARLLGQFKEDAYTPTFIVGVAKGGVIPASLIHQHYPDAAFGIVHMKSYGGEFLAREPEFVGINSFNAPDAQSTLIIDDILDSGRSYDFLRSQFPNSTYAFMSVRHNKVTEVKYHGWIWGEGWVDFPWERKLAPIVPAF